jgi:hypothetical protein
MLIEKKLALLICQHPVDSIPSCLNKHSPLFSGTFEHQKLSYQTMSYTSEEESEINFQQQHKSAVCEAALSKGNPINSAAKKRRSHPGNPGKEIVSVFMSSSKTS